MNISKGTIINFSIGEYSDYHIMATMVALEDITKEDYQKAAAAELNKGRYQQEYEVVIANLVKAGKLADVTSVEVHVGSYGMVEKKMNVL